MSLKSGPLTAIETCVVAAAAAAAAAVLDRWRHAHARASGLSLPVSDTHQDDRLIRLEGLRHKCVGFDRFVLGWRSREPGEGVIALSLLPCTHGHEY